MTTFRQDHELHDRRSGRNWGLFLVLAGLVAIVFGLTYVKITTGNPMEAFDHSVRPALIQQEAQ
ncbi:hypothetical protein [Algirhabdus cladophorae]|uniref:hypothetical protein n=1 Tax=Algirhabdus cladophorae TaxID=3377108 RepID=UPI003B8473BB